MTFTLKDLTQFKKSIPSALETLFGRDQTPEQIEKNKNLTTAQKIRNLPDHRKEQVRFLNTLFVQIIEDASEKEDTTEYQKILYGAMLTLQEDIKRTRGFVESWKKENGLLIQSLDACMFDKGSNSAQMDPQQITDCYKAFNKYMNTIYKDNDSRNGYNIANLFKGVEQKKLETLCQLGVELEEGAQNNVISALSTKGKSHFEPEKYTVTRPIASEIVKKFVNFATLKAELEFLFTQEKSKIKVARLSLLGTRAPQMEYLEAIANALTPPKELSSTNTSHGVTISESEKMAILLGAMYIVRAQIAIQYRFDDPLVLSTASTSRKASAAHEKLTEILRSQDESPENIAEMVRAANRFTRHAVIQPPRTEMRNVAVDNEENEKAVKPAKVPAAAATSATTSTSIPEAVMEKVHFKATVRKNNIFAGIENLKFTETQEVGQKIIRACHDAALKTCITHHSDDIRADGASPGKQPPASGGIFSGFFTLGGSEKSSSNPGSLFGDGVSPTPESTEGGESLKPETHPGNGKRKFFGGQKSAASTAATAANLKP